MSQSTLNKAKIPESKQKSSWNYLRVYTRIWRYSKQPEKTQKYLKILSVVSVLSVENMQKYLKLPKSS